MHIKRKMWGPSKEISKFVGGRKGGAWGMLEEVEEDSGGGGFSHRRWLCFKYLYCLNMDVMHLRHLTNKITYGAYHKDGPNRNYKELVADLWIMAKHSTQWASYLDADLDSTFQDVCVKNSKKVSLSLNNSTKPITLKVMAVGNSYL